MVTDKKNKTKQKR